MLMPSENDLREDLNGFERIGITKHHPMDQWEGKE